MSRVGKSKPLIFRALAEGSVSRVKKALREDSKAISATTGPGKSPLHVAVEAKQLPIVKLLLSKKANINAVDNDRWTALHIAAFNSSLDICQELLKSKDIDVNIKTIDGTTAFCYLVRIKSIHINDDWKLYKKVLKMMVQKRADVNASTDSGESPLQQACLRGTTVSVEFLLNSGVGVDSTNSKKETALHWVVMRKKLAMVQTLMKYGADPYFSASPGMSTPMEIALSSGQMEEIVAVMKAKSLVIEEARVKCRQEGVLEIYQRSRWQSVFCVLKGSIFFVYPNNELPQRKPILALDLMRHLFRTDLPDRECRGAEHAFKLEEPDVSSFLLRAASDDDRRVWITQWENARSDHQSGGPVHGSEQEKKQNNDEIDDSLTRLLELQENMVCADCGASAPYWMLESFGALVCYDCAVLHEELGTSPIRSIYFDAWTMAHTLILKCHGNRKHNDKWEATLPLTYTRPAIFHEPQAKRDFLQQKYLAQSFQSATQDSAPSPRFVELRRAIAQRIAHWESHYPLRLILDSLPVPMVLWQHLIDTSPLYAKLASATQPDKSEQYDQVLLALMETRVPHVASFLRPLLPQALALIRTMGTMGTMGSCTDSQGATHSTRTRSVKILLLNLVATYQQRQASVGVADRHGELIMKWWLPQVVEVLAIVQANHERNDLSLLLNLFRRHAAMALYLLAGEYLLTEGALPFPAATPLALSVLQEQAQALKQQCHALTQSVRALLTASQVPKPNLHKYKSGTDTSTRHYSPQVTHSLTERTDSCSSVSRTKSSDYHLNSLWRNSSWGSSPSLSSRDQAQATSSSTGGGLMDNPEDPPLLLLHQNAPSGLSSMLCSVVSELPLVIQRQLLRVVCVGHDFSPAEESWEEQDDSMALLPLTSSDAVQLAVSIVEALRQQWPRQGGGEGEEASHWPRLLYLVRSTVECLYSFPVFWSSPELWEAWHRLHDILYAALDFLCAALSSPFPRASLSSVLCLLVVQLRWTFAKLCELQDRYAS